MIPRYFVAIHNDIETVDYEGLDLSDIDAARVEAVKSARALICDSIMTHGRVVLHHSITVTDEADAVVLTIPFGDALTIAS